MFKKIISLIKINLFGCKKESILSIIFVTIETIAEVMVPLIMSHLIDNGIYANDFYMIKKISTILFIFVVCQMSTGVLCAIFAVRASTTFAYNLRSNIFKKIQSFSFKNIDKFKTGSLVVRTTTDVLNIKQSYQILIRGMVRAILMIIFSTYAACKISSIGLYMLMSIPLVFISFFFIAKSALPFFKKVFKNIDDLNNNLSENIRGIRVVKSFSREKYEEKKFIDISKNIFNNFIKAESIAVLWMPIMNFIMYSINIIIAFFGTKAIILSHNNEKIGLTTGQLVSLITYSQQMIGSLMLLSFLTVSILISVESFMRIVEIFDEELDIKNIENPIFNFKNFNIEFKNVNFKFKNKSKSYILKNINIIINEGEKIGITGATGSGKSTFVNLIPRLYDVTSGEILIGGINIKNYDMEILRKKIGKKKKKNILFSGTVKTNINFGNEYANDDDIKKALKIAGAYEFIEKKEDGINSYVEQLGVNFSGGQKQRICIARAIIKKPKILIFDDATASVDSKTEKIIFDNLYSEFKNITQIIISQKISSLNKCDKIIVFDKGEIVDFDTHDNLLKNSKIYKEICDLQNEFKND